MNKENQFGVKHLIAATALAGVVLALLTGISPVVTAGAVAILFGYTIILVGILILLLLGIKLKTKTTADAPDRKPTLWMTFLLVSAGIGGLIGFLIGSASGSPFRADISGGGPRDPNATDHYWCAAVVAFTFWCVALVIKRLYYRKAVKRRGVDKLTIELPDDTSRV